MDSIVREQINPAVLPQMQIKWDLARYALPELVQHRLLF